MTMDINRIQRVVFLNTTIKIAMNINVDKHPDCQHVYDPQIVEALAIATAFQKFLPISSSETNVDMYFNQQYNQSIANIVNEIHEHHKIDWRQVIDLVRKIWRIRYYSTYPRSVKNTIPTNTNTEHFSYFDIINNTPMEMSLDDIKILNTECKCKQFSSLVSTYFEYIDKYFNDIANNEKMNQAVPISNV